MSEMTNLFINPQSLGMRFDREAPRRIHIIGTSGTGKTTLARQIGSELEAGVHDLDAIGYAGAYEGQAGTRRPLDLRLADVHLIATQPSWVSEGMFLWWIDELLVAADLIVWLDLHWRLAGWRIVKRHVRRSLARNNTHPGLRNLAEFVWEGRADYHNIVPGVPKAPDDDSAITRAGTLVELTRFSNKTVRCTSQRDVGALLDALKT